MLVHAIQGMSCRSTGIWNRVLKWTLVLWFAMKDMGFLPLISTGWTCNKFPVKVILLGDLMKISSGIGQGMYFIIGTEWLFVGVALGIGCSARFAWLPCSSFLFHLVLFLPIQKLLEFTCGHFGKIYTSVFLTKGFNLDSSLSDTRTVIFPEYEDIGLHSSLGGSEMSGSLGLPFLPAALILHCFPAPSSVGCVQKVQDSFLGEKRCISPAWWFAVALLPSPPVVQQWGWIHNLASNSGIQEEIQAFISLPFGHTSPVSASLFCCQLLERLVRTCQNIMCFPLK